MIADYNVPASSLEHPLPLLNSRLEHVARAIDNWTHMRNAVPQRVWSYPPVVALVTKLDWDVLKLGHAVSSRGEGTGNPEDMREIDRRLNDVETTIVALEDILQTGSMPGASPSMREPLRHN